MHIVTTNNINERMNHCYGQQYYTIFTKHNSRTILQISMLILFICRYIPLKLLLSVFTKILFNLISNFDFNQLFLNYYLVSYKLYHGNPLYDRSGNAFLLPVQALTPPFQVEFSLKGWSKSMAICHLLTMQYSVRLPYDIVFTVSNPNFE